MAKALPYRKFLDLFLNVPIIERKPNVKKIVDSVCYTAIFFAEILEIKDEFLVVNCLINEKSETFQKRSFDIAPFVGMNLSVNDILQIKVFTKQGERRFQYSKSIAPGVRGKFNKVESLFQNLDVERLFPKVSTVEDEDYF